MLYTGAQYHSVEILMSKKDTLFSEPVESIKPFAFDDQVVSVFEDMIQRSVPGYAELVKQIGLLSKEVVTPNSRVYDLGTSLGAVTLAVRRHVSDDSVAVIAVDSSPAMVKCCRELLEAYTSNVPVTVIEDDILNINIQDASLVVLNFTLQFIAPERREQLIKTIYEGLQPGGVLVLSEKIEFPGENIDKLIINLHEKFKRTQGYSELEISQKRDALQNVMLPETVSAHMQRLSSAGFNEISVWYQQYNFASLLAVK